VVFLQPKWLKGARTMEKDALKDMIVASHCAVTVSPNLATSQEPKKSPLFQYLKNGNVFRQDSTF
jgi:hypothetical protein